MYAPKQSTTTVPDGLARLISQFQTKPILTAELTSFLQRIQEIEDTLWQIILGRSIIAVTSPGGVTLKQAVGVQLDIIGKIVGCPRAGLIDSDYLIALAAQIFVNRASGSPEDFLHLLLISCPAGSLYSYAESYPATVQIQIISTVTWSIAVTFRYLAAVKAAGVRLLLEYSETDTTNNFCFATNNAVEVDALQGWGDTTDATVGGKFQGVLQA